MGLIVMANGTKIAGAPTLTKVTGKRRFSYSYSDPMIIKTPSMEKSGEKNEAVIASVDIFPTLCELTKLLDSYVANGHSTLGPTMKRNAK